jgi:hypothetical protein
LLAAALGVFGLALLVALASRLNAAGFALLFLGVFNVVLATWINTALARAEPDCPAEPPDATPRA